MNAFDGRYTAPCPHGSLVACIAGEHLPTAIDGAP